MNLDDETLAPPPGDMPVMRGSKMNVSIPSEPEYIPEIPDYLQNQGAQMMPPGLQGNNDPVPF